MATQKEREIFARNFRRIIDNSHMNFADVAAKMEMSRGTISDYLHCRAYPRPAMMTKLCHVLGVSQYDLTTDGYIEENVDYINREVAALARNIYENPDARALYTAILQLEPEEITAMKTLAMNLSRNRRKTDCE